MARGSSADRAVFGQLDGTTDGGWVAGTDDVSAFMRGKYLAYAGTPEEKQRAAAYADAKARILQGARDSLADRTGVNVVSLPGVVGNDNVVYSTSMVPGESLDKVDRGSSTLAGDTSTRDGTVRELGFTSLGKNRQAFVGLREGEGQDAAAEEANHLWNYVIGSGRDSSKTNFRPGYGSDSFRSEAFSALGGLIPWTATNDGGRHMVLDQESLTKFLDHLKSRASLSGKSNSDFVRPFDMPDNSREFIRSYLDGDEDTRKFMEDIGNWNATASTGGIDHSTYAASKAGKLRQMSSFLATDDVPDTLFGIPVVSDPQQYTEEDLRFFEEHPEAGGYYDMGEREET